ncbi:AI-2E family transporter [Soehngenia longivitae]|uniref:AI-2E family transporter n=1 Tax=Soehngenia longivitae TaxID=2562294 RepID=A0A4Z0D644_9FIRM|nr:AI-2E family transporter [Soehngenia longivitae]TFZ40338.1 AI-2E family transporter [Soehngenia longivitae]
MKIEWNKKYTTISAYSIIVVFISMLFYIIISEFGLFIAGLNRYIKVFAPFTIGFAIAYLANFIMDFIERKAISPLLSKRKGNKVKRIVSLLLTYLLLIAGLFLFIYLVLPQLINSVTGAVYMVINNYDSLSKSIIDFISKLNISQSYIDDIVLRWNNFVDNIINFISNSLPLIGTYAGRLFSSIWNIILGIIISVYMLIDKERFSMLLKKLNFSIFSKERATRNIELTKRADNIFGRFLVGKIIDSIIIAILTYIVLIITKMPYSLLIAFIIGVTNIIPFFGPFIGAIPSFFIILFVSPIKALWFLVIILIIQQLDGNLIGPKILGDSLGISAFWILFSLLISGEIFGFIGLIIGVPLFVFIYSIVKDNVEKRLLKKGLPVETNKYKEY